LAGLNVPFPGTHICAGYDIFETPSRVVQRRFDPFPLGDIRSRANHIFHIFVLIERGRFGDGQQTILPIGIGKPLLCVHGSAGLENLNIGSLANVSLFGGKEFLQPFISDILDIQAQKIGVGPVESSIGFCVGQRPDLGVDGVQKQAPFL